jgi:hypothetical protein
MLLGLMISTCGFSAELITNYSTLESLHHKLSKNPTYLKKIIGKQEIKINQLGRALSAIYQIDGQYRRFYQNYLNKCFEVTINEASNLARKVKCQNNPKVSLKNKPEFELIDLNYFKEHEPVEVEIKRLQKKIELNAFVHTYRDLLGEPIEAYPTQKYTVEINGAKTLRYGPKFFTITNEVRFDFSKLGFHHAKPKIDRQVLSYTNGDYLFTNHQGEFVLYKRYQMRPLNFKSMWLADSYLEYLDQIENHLFDYNGQKYCFRDDLLTPSAYDCQRLVVKQQPLYDYADYVSERVP